MNPLLLNICQASEVYTPVQNDSYLLSMSTESGATAAMATFSSSIVSEAFENRTLVVDLIPFNLEAIERSAIVWKCRSTLPQTLTQYLYRRNTNEDKKSDPYNQQLNADDLTTINDGNNGTHYSGFCLTTANFNYGNQLLAGSLGKGRGRLAKKTVVLAFWPATLASTR